MYACAVFFFSSRRRHTRCLSDWSSDVCSSDLYFFELQLTRGPCLLLVDGLDEAPNETARETVSRLIERAARAWTNCRFVVTTRPRAYEDEVMLAGFHHARIGPLEPADVRTFLERWSVALISESPERGKRHAAELIQAVEGKQ